MQQVKIAAFKTHGIFLTGLEVYVKSLGRLEDPKSAIIEKARACLWVWDDSTPHNKPKKKYVNVIIKKNAIYYKSKKLKLINDNEVNKWQKNNPLNQ